MPRGKSAPHTLLPQTCMDAWGRYQCLLAAIENPHTVALNHIELHWVRVLDQKRDKITLDSELNLIPAVVVRIKYPYVNGAHSAYKANDQRRELQKLRALLEADISRLQEDPANPLSKAMHKGKVRKITMELVDTAKHKGGRTTDPKFICEALRGETYALELA